MNSSLLVSTLENSLVALAKTANAFKLPIVDERVGIPKTLRKQSMQRAGRSSLLCGIAH